MNRKTNNQFIKKLRRIIPASMGIPLIMVLVWNTLVYNGSRLITTDLYHHNLESPLDQLVPFLPWTVSIYLVCYLFWVANYVIAVRQEEEEAWKFLGADFLAKMVCLFCFILLPSTNVRPEVGDSSLWCSVMKLVYRVDAADNLFPSIHCLVSWFCYIGVRKNPSIPRWYSFFSLIFALMVCVSTLTTKQHVIVDTFAGVLLAEGCYYLSAKTGFYKVYEKALKGVLKRRLAID